MPAHPSSKDQAVCEERSDYICQNLRPTTVSDISWNLFDVLFFFQFFIVGCSASLLRLVNMSLATHVRNAGKTGVVNGRQMLIRRVRKGFWFEWPAGWSS
ncbi:hypothetical protein Q1695_013883 [Nippostrongylus brasiliensis]|nr:hypothetical protein Q1695_013883 [Nippostrongylus brasiliensis]